MKAFTVLLAIITITVPSSSDDACPIEQETDGTIEKLLQHEDCDKFYKCTYGVPVEQDCPPGLLFSLEEWRCEWPYLVDCGERNVPGDAISTDEPETMSAKKATQSTTSTISDFITEPTTLSPETSSTADAAVITTSVSAIETNTSELSSTMETNDNIDSTTFTVLTSTAAMATSTNGSIGSITTTTSVNLTTSTTESTTSATATTSLPAVNTTTTAAPEFNPNGCPVNLYRRWLFPHETDCSLFYYCVWGERQLRACPNGLHFNREILVCDWPRDAGCEIEVAA